jgi:hypothetical protein
MEVSHDNGHDYFGFILNDGNFSITSFIFWAYHGWIDYAIEVRLRRGGSGPKTEDYIFLKNQMDKTYTLPPDLPSEQNESSPDQLKDKVGPNFAKLQRFMDKLSNLDISSSDPINPNYAGYYPITEWIKLQRLNNVGGLEDMSAGFCSRDLILTKDERVRTSFHFNDAYKKYLQVYADRFRLFPDVGTINFNYNYQVGARPADINTNLS